LWNKEKREKMKELTVYQCEHCKKLFRTPNRHNCKFNPKFKNCHSCKFCRGFTDEDYIGGVDVGVGTMPTNMLYPTCMKDCGDYSALEITRMGYKLNCSEYEYCGGRWYDYKP